MKMNQLFTGYYSDRRTAYEKPLDYIYAKQGDSAVTIQPTIWLWKSDRSPTYFVDYIGGGVSCTLKTFSSLKEAETYRDEIGTMTENEFENWLINIHWKRNEVAK